MAKVLSYKAGEEAGTMWVKVLCPTANGELFVVSKRELDFIKFEARREAFDLIREVMLKHLDSELHAKPE